MEFYWKFRCSAVVRCFCICFASRCQSSLAGQDNQANLLPAASSSKCIYLFENSILDCSGHLSETGQGEDLTFLSIRPTTVSDIFSCQSQKVSIATLLDTQIEFFFANSTNFWEPMIPWLLEEVVDVVVVIRYCARYWDRVATSKLYSFSRTKNRVCKVYSNSLLLFRHKSCHVIKTSGHCFIKTCFFLKSRATTCSNFKNNLKMFNASF